MPNHRNLLWTAICAVLALACASIHSAPPAGSPEPAAPAAGAVPAVDAAAAEEAAAAEAEATDDNLIVRLDPNAAPTAQRVRLRLDPAQSTYQGSTEVEVEIKSPVDQVLFHAQDHTFNKLQLTGADGLVEVDVTREENQGLVRLRPKIPIPAGDYLLQIDFTQDYNTRAVGLYKTEYKGAPYLFTQLQAIDARRAFPCWDEPGYKIPYQLTLEVPEGNLAVTNTPEAATSSADGWTTIEFETTPPTPSYLLAIAVGNFEAIPVEGAGTPGKILAVQGLAEMGRMAAEMTPPILAALEEYFGIAYPYAKLDQIAVPEFWPGAMENPGLITYADRILLLPEGAGARQRRRLAQVMAHEFAHMWFGDLVTMQWWDDLWLNESFAAWMENKIPQQLYPELRPALAGRTATQDVMVSDARPSTRAIRRTVETSDDIFGDLGIVYEKGAGVLTMVEQWLGEEAFRDGVRLYMERHAWGNATADDFWAALSEASGEDVASILTGFILQPGLPLLNVEQRDGDWWLTQQRFHAEGVEVAPQTWKIPITLSYSAAGEVGSLELLLSEEAVPLGVPVEVDWILPDAGARGYYRWSIPQEHSRNLALDAAAALTPRERASILNNASALLDAGLMGGAEYLELLAAFSADPDPDVLSRVLDGVEKVGETFVDDSNRDLFAGYVRSALQPIAERIGWQKVDGEIETTHNLRRRLFSALGGAGEDPEVRKLAKEMTRQFLDDPASVDAELAGRALRITALDGDEELYETYRQRFENPQSPQDRGMFLGGMAHFSNPELRQRTREYGLSDAVNPTEMFTAFGGDRTDADAMASLTWVLDHYEGFEQKLAPEWLGFMPRWATGCSRERLELATEFFSDPENQVTGTLNNLKRVTESVNQCLALRDREGEAVSAYLEQFGD